MNRGPLLAKLSTIKTGCGANNDEAQIKMTGYELHGRLTWQSYGTVALRILEWVILLGNLLVCEYELITHNLEYREGSCETPSCRWFPRGNLEIWKA